mmetsp:Transcript_10353/g.23229  ORF Transcript_10353/g.23229 Transcript_10353/m.23229 type:complete len:208 (+) Transcript_10353:289-912(+)
MNISTAFAKSTGASALIMRTSSSDFIILLIRARGRSLWFLKSCSVSVLVVPSSRISRSWSVQKPWSRAPSLFRNSGEVAEQTGPESSSRGEPDTSMGAIPPGIALAVSVGAGTWTDDEAAAAAGVDVMGAGAEALSVVGLGTVATRKPAYSAAAFCFRKVACRSAISCTALALTSLISASCFANSFFTSFSCAALVPVVGVDARFCA